MTFQDSSDTFHAVIDSTVAFAVLVISLLVLYPVYLAARFVKSLGSTSVRQPSGQ